MSETYKQGVAQDFNPHSRKGSDLDVGIQDLQQSIFQSTLPQGE